MLAAVVGQEFKPDPVALGQPALSLLDVIPVVRHNIPEFAYLRQTNPDERRGGGGGRVAQADVGVFRCAGGKLARGSTRTWPRGCLSLHRRRGERVRRAAHRPARRVGTASVRPAAPAGRVPCRAIVAWANPGHRRTPGQGDHQGVAPSRDAEVFETVWRGYPTG